MDYIVMERIVFDALVSQIADCTHTVEKFMKLITPRSLDDWIDNNAAKSLLRLGTRSLQTMRSSGKIGYSIIDGKVFYPMGEIYRVLNQYYTKDG